MKDTVIINRQPVTREAVREFKRQYKEALARGDEWFDHGGQQVLVAYAKHVVEYAESVLGRLD